MLQAWLNDKSKHLVEEKKKDSSNFRISENLL